MPIEYRIFPERRLVVARGFGTVTNEDVFGYQREAWSSPEVAGFDELVDMTRVQEIAVPSAERLQELVTVSASMDRAPGGAKFAIVAPQDLAFALGRMYEAYRQLDSRSTKIVEVFRTMAEALAFLGVEGQLEPWENI